MSEVSVNIRGRDDGLGSTIDSLREKVTQLNRDMGQLNNLDNLSKTERVVEVERASRDTAEEQKRRVRQEYADSRRLNEEDMEDAKKRHAAG
ncbi:MAG: hypothetical protein ABIN48_06090, partial [Ginsengibacter sp.]